MKNYKFTFCLAALAFVGAWVPYGLFRPKPNPSSVNDPVASLSPDESYGRLPLYFEPNQGQSDPQVKFLARGNGYNLFVTSKEAVLALNQPDKNFYDKFRPFHRSHPLSKYFKPKPATVLRLKLAGSNPDPIVEGSEKLPGISNYFIGNDPSKWRTNIPNYAKVKLKDVYPGVDMVYYGNQRHLEYDFVVAPGADPKVIRLALSGSNKTFLDSNGNLFLKRDKGEVAFRRPVIYQVKGGRKEIVEGRYAMAGNHQIGFEVDHYDKAEPLVIDPVLDYSTYLGGVNEALGNAIAVDSSGNAYVTGHQASTDFPITSGAYQGTQDIYHAHVFVTKLNPSGTALVYSTFLEGNNEDYGCAIAVDSSGNAYIGGNTLSTNFPVSAGAFETTQDGVGLPSGVTVYGTAENAFVTKLNGAGNDIDYSTYLGGFDFDEVLGIAVDSNGDAYVTGETDDNYPTTAGAYLTSALAYNDFAFVTKLNTMGTGLIYSTLLGGNNPSGGVGGAGGYGIAVDSGGNAYITGYSRAYFPTTTGAFQTKLKGATNAFVSKLNAAGSALVYSTYLGGSGNDQPSKIALDINGNAFVTGVTASSDFPTTPKAFQTTLKGTQNAFVTKLNATGTALLYSTFLGGDNEDGGLAIAVDSAGDAYINGNTKSADFPITSGAFQMSLVGAESVFLTKLNETGNQLLYSTYFGESSNGVYGGINGAGIALDGNGNAYLTGATESTDFPTTAGAYQTALGGSSATNAFVTKFDKSAFYTSTPTITATPTITSTPTITDTPTSTFTPTWTGTSTVTSTATQTPTATPTPGYLGPKPPTPGTSFVYPSPATGGTLNIAYDMEEGGRAQVLIWNESAQLVSNTSQSQWAGPQMTTINIQGWARGVYFYQVVLHYDSGKEQKLKPDKFLIGWW